MIVGILIFVKKLPDILKESLGLDGGTFKDFKLNPLKRLENDMLGAKQIAGVGAAGLAGAAAFGSNLASGVANKKGLFGKTFGALGSAIAGGTSASVRGLGGAAKGEKFGKNFSNSYSAAMKNKQARADRLDDGVKWGEMMSSKMRQTMGIHTKGEAVKAANDKLKAIQDSYKSMESAAIGNDTGNFSATIGGAARTFAGIKDLEKFAQEVRKTTINRESYATDQDYLDAVQAHNQTLKEIDDAKDARLNSLAAGTASTGDAATDAAITGNYAQMRKMAQEVNSITSSIDSNIADINIAAGSTAKSINGQSKGITQQVAGSIDAQHAQTVDQYGAKKGQK